MHRQGSALVGLAAAGLLAGCPGWQLRAGYPWVESSELALEDESLAVTVRPDGAEVDVALKLAARRRTGALGLAFPEDRRDPPLEQLSVRFEGRWLAWRPARSSPGFLPLAGVERWFVFELPALQRGESGLLRVRYRQRLQRDGSGCRFRYLLRTGAYWRGPIGELRASVRAEGVRVRSARLDGKPAAAAGPEGFSWLARRLEPREDLLVETECTGRE